MNPSIHQSIHRCHDTPRHRLTPRSAVSLSDATSPPPFSNFTCSAAYQPTSEQECLVEEEVSQACIEYAAKLDELQAALKSIAPQVRDVRRLADDVKAVKMRAQPAKPAADSPQLRAALKRAQEQAKEHGDSSPEARVAWSEVEDIASAGLDNSMGVRLDEECLVESALEACQALEELNRAIDNQSA